MNGDIVPKVTNLENAFVNYDDMEDSWKLDLCYLVEGLLLADEPTSKVNLDFFSFVEDEDFFFFSIFLGLELILQDLCWC